MVPLLLHQRFQIPVETLVAPVPEAPISLRPFGDGFERLRFESPGSPLRLPATRYEPRSLEDAEVLGNGGPTHRERRRNLLDGGLSLRESSQNGSSRRIGEGGKD